MKVLLFTSPGEDYLQDSIIHGFKELYGKEVLEYPVKDFLYNDFPDLKNIYGKGFTLYGLLNPDLKPGISKIASNDFDQFDLIVFTSIHRQYEYFYAHLEVLKKIKAKVWLMDGEDTPVVFPYMGKQLKHFLFSPKPHHLYVYFKRELLPETLNSIYYRLPVCTVKLFPIPKNINPISFSIPAGKIMDRLPVKNKLFMLDVVDEEVALHIYGKSERGLFDSEQEYYKDIQNSRFGITTKRAGWDCLRHYEIAANGAVICFRHLDKKPKSCAPHGLIPGFNCISYSDVGHLMTIVNNLNDEAYNSILKHSYEWIKTQTTIARVKGLLNSYLNYKSC